MKTDELQIKQLIENWVAAVKVRNLDNILAHHDKDIIMFDVPGPFQSIGIDEYKKTWNLFFTGTEAGVFDIQTLKIVAGEDVAFCIATMKCKNHTTEGTYAELDFRLTIGLKKINDQWTVLHEHHSVPSN